MNFMNLAFCPSKNTSFGFHLPRCFWPQPQRFQPPPARPCVRFQPWWNQINGYMRSIWSVLKPVWAFSRFPHLNFGWLMGHTVCTISCTTEPYNQRDKLPTNWFIHEQSRHILSKYLPSFEFCLGIQFFNTLPSAKEPKRVVAKCSATPLSRNWPFWKGQKSPSVLMASALCPSAPSGSSACGIT